MRLITSISARRRRRRLPRAKLPWAELEAEALRQGCSAADVLFDWAGRPEVTPPAGVPGAVSAVQQPIGARLVGRGVHALRRNLVRAAPRQQA